MLKQLRKYDECWSQMFDLSRADGTHSTGGRAIHGDSNGKLPLAAVASGGDVNWGISEWSPPQDSSSGCNRATNSFPCSLIEEGEVSLNGGASLTEVSVKFIDAPELLSP